MKLAKHILRYFNFYVDLRRWQREGILNAVRRYLVWRKILHSPVVQTTPCSEGAVVEVHLLCCRRDYLTAIWALKSFYFNTAVRYPLVIHVQGEISCIAVARLRKHFPRAKIILPQQATEMVHTHLRERCFNRLSVWRNLNPFMLKLVDFNILAQAEVIITLDSDVLFFSHPSEIITAVCLAKKQGSATVQRDIESTYNITSHDAAKNWAINLPKQVNTGMMIRRKDSIDLKMCETFLSDSDIARNTGFIEQSLYAMCLADKIEYLPNTYLISRQEKRDHSELVMRHYAGDSRSLLTSEGLPYLLENGKWLHKEGQLLEQSA